MDVTEFFSVVMAVVAKVEGVGVEIVEDKNGCTLDTGGVGRGGDHGEIKVIIARAALSQE